MTRHPRIPAVAALVISGMAGLSILAGTGQFRTTDLSRASLEMLEKQIVNSPDPAIWCAYGEKLRQAGRYGAAAKAYQRALELQPELTSARLNEGLALGQSRDADAFFAYYTRLSANYPKLAVDLLERPELAPLRSDVRWEPAASSARAQAVD
jgi:tetratricopeptide (TPR) repeat protein